MPSIFYMSESRSPGVRRKKPPVRAKRAPRGMPHKPVLTIHPASCTGNQGVALASFEGCSSNSLPCGPGLRASSRMVSLVHEQTQRRLKVASRSTDDGNVGPPATPVIVLSARDPAENKQRSIGAGATAFFQKPPDNHEFLAAIRQALGDCRTFQFPQNLNQSRPNQACCR